MADVTPFLSPSEFAGMFPRTLTAAETALVGKLLTAAAMWIRERDAAAGKTERAADDPMALLVTYEVVRDAIALPGGLAGHVQYSRQTDDRIDSGTLRADVGGLLDFNERHYMLLGLSASVGPVWGGMDGDFGEPYPSRQYGRIAAVVVGDFPE
jgi:hypothetical protein